MADKEKSRIPQRKAPDLDDDAEAAAARLWAVYVSEAEKYDKALVESWKSDMDGLLIFTLDAQSKAGLFSASLTAFIIESYKTLNRDSGDLTVQLLAQISLQLAASPNGTPIQIPPSTPGPFTPSATALICNILWFFSLGLSLACALIATLVQQCTQWSKLSPLLLHASLLSFFAGLVAFLIPVDRTMTAVAAALLFIVAAVYSTLTVLPLRYLDCPYRTPLSGSFWHFSQSLDQLLRRRRSRIDEGDADASYEAVNGLRPAPESMVEAMSRSAMQRSDERSERDHRALVWTMKSLADDVELETFVEAIPDLLWGPRTRRYSYENHIRRLVQNHEVQFTTRITTLLDSCDSGILPPNARKRRRITCYMALWAIGSLSRPIWSSGQSNFGVDFSSFTLVYGGLLEVSDEEIAPYFTSAKAMMLWSTFCALQSRLITLGQQLAACDSADVNPDLAKISSSIHETSKFFAAQGLIRHLSQTALIPDLQGIIDEMLYHVPYKILFQYLASSAQLKAPPYRWTETRDAIHTDPSVHFSVFNQELEYRLRQVISQLDRMNASEDITWLDITVAAFLSFWRPESAVSIPHSIIQFLNHRHSSSALKQVLGHGTSEMYLWSSFPTTLSCGSPSFGANMISRQDLLAALWRLASLNTHLRLKDQSLVVRLVSILEVLSEAETSLSHISNSIIALIKHRILYEITQTSFSSSFNHLIFPIETIVQVSDEDQQSVSNMMRARRQEARIYILAEFLQHCNSEVLPYRAVETLEAISHRTVPREGIHHAHQLRLADSVRGIFTAERFPDLLPVIINCECWTVYAKQPKFGPFEERPWLYDPVARGKIKDAFTHYEGKLGSIPDSSTLLVRLKKILQGLDSWHLQSDRLLLTSATESRPVRAPESTAFSETMT
ncbi:hypothetical protein MVEN_02592100 [Mycena venus]|uniref:DUF6535 domain-containing protein n=1 Tax=Mycena venus TaxID=2733690 RepID=A0A8H6WR61_9AGAR|nr:hypothetical protein MVEN_02592100 [Mycena venus]